MAEKNNGLFPKWLQDGFVNLLNPLVRLSAYLNMSPHTYTVSGLIITVAAALLLFWNQNNINLAGFLFLLGGICDIMDGKLARNSNKVTKFGALFDSAVDRYAEVAMFFGIGAFYIIGDHYLLSFVTFIALGGSTMVSYVRARAEGLGLSAKVGFMQRPERVVFIGAGALFHYPLFSITMFHVVNFPVTLMEIVIWIVAIMSNYTAIQRIMYIYKISAKEHNV